MSLLNNQSAFGNVFGDPVSGRKIVDVEQQLANKLHDTAGLAKTEGSGDYLDGLLSVISGSPRMQAFVGMKLHKLASEVLKLRKELEFEKAVAARVESALAARVEVK